MKDKKDVSVEFLMKEFDNTYAEWRRMSDAGNPKLQFLFTVIAVVVSGISISISGLKQDELAFIFVIASALLSIIGWQAYDFMIARMISIDYNTRALARIRRFFVENDPEILKYLTWQTDDLPTRFSVDKRRGIMWVTQILFCVLLSCFISALHFAVQRIPFYVAFTFLFTLVMSYIWTLRQIKGKVDRYRHLAERDSRFNKIDSQSYEDLVSKFYSKEKINTPQ